MYGLYDVFEYLLSSGADFALCDLDGQLSSIVASFSGYYDIVRLLTSQGALRDEYDSNA